MTIVEQTSQAQPLPGVIHPHQFHPQQQLSLSASNTNEQIARNGTHKSHTSTTSVLGSSQSLSPALQAYLVRTRDVVGLRVQHWYIYASRGVSADIRAGPAIVKSWSNAGKPIHSTVSWKDGTCIVLTMQTQWPLIKRINIVVSVIFKEPKLSFNCGLAMHSVLQTSHPAYVACAKGDWPTLRRLLEAQEANISDTTGFGDSLLHVCTTLNVLNTIVLILQQLAAHNRHYDVMVGLLQAGAEVDATNDFGE